MSTNVDIHHLAAAYALDALDPHERAVFEAHYPECDVCSQDVVQFRATLAEMGAASAVAPPDALKARMMAEIATTRQLSPLLPDGVAALASRRPRLTQRTLAAAAALVLIVGAVAFAVGRSGKDDDPFAAELEHVLNAPDARMVDLPTTSSAATGRIHLVWSRSAQEIAVLGEDLAPATSGKAYELWMIDAKGSVPVYLLDPADGGSVRRVMHVDGTPLQWGITVEPKSGSPVPTGEILFLGNA